MTDVIRSPISLTRDATNDEVNYYIKVRPSDDICCIPNCGALKLSGHGACDTHMEVFREQRDAGIKDFRLWALWRMNRFDPEADPTVLRFPVQISTSECQHKQKATLKAPKAVSLALMWREVYDRTGLPEDDIYMKYCACCEHDEFTQSEDYICLWCRWADL